MSISLPALNYVNKLYDNIQCGYRSVVLLKRQVDICVRICACTYISSRACCMHTIAHVHIVHTYICPRTYRQADRGRQTETDRLLFPLAFHGRGLTEFLRERGPAVECPVAAMAHACCTIIGSFAEQELASPDRHRSSQGCSAMRSSCLHSTSCCRS